MTDITKTDPEVANAINEELKRAQDGVEMIASENFVSKAVLQAMGTVLTNKYSEGYPGHRYYGGNEIVDITENLAIERAKKLFGAAHANVQPHAGSQANMQAYFTILKPGDTILGLNLAHGGHLTHGSPVNFSGKMYNIVPYGIDVETGRINMDEVRELAQKHRPKLVLSGFSAYPRTLDFKKFREIAEEVDAYHMADIAHIAGLCATGVHQNPMPYCDIVTTTTHKTLRGPRGAMILCQEEDRLKDKYCPDEKKNLAQRIDFSVFPGTQGGPLDHIIAAKAVAFGEDLRPEFKTYSEQIVKNAKVLAQTLMDNGMKLVSDGTDNHLMLIDVWASSRCSGKEAELALDKAHIYTNKNMIPTPEGELPLDSRGKKVGTPFNPTGIRIGTPALTTRGLREPEMETVGKAIVKVLNNFSDEGVLRSVSQDILELCKKFPLYPGLGILR
ncbi:MAG: serine hydroxymethyltransferase [Nanoarchaeota archaeon]|nr:serine hydroxymethyltransferase [Nanoarchaeota archaeon]MBU1704512.1 serine hydroxymethyltransferase [Nanoarchaeota archaeon]